jgi:hypothetical protein
MAGAALQFVDAGANLRTFSKIWANALLATPSTALTMIEDTPPEIADGRRVKNKIKTGQNTDDLLE